MAKVSQEELEKSIKYLDSLDLEKGQTSMDFSEATNGGKEEQVQKMKSDLHEHIQKAKEIKEALDKLEKSEDPKEDLEDEDKKEDKDKGKEKEEPKEKEKEEKPNFDKEEIIKSVRDSLFTEVQEILKSKDTQIIELSNRLEQISNEPIRKSVVGGQSSIVERFQKSKSEGKTPVFKNDKVAISNHLYNLFTETEDEIMKSKVSDAITQFESASYLDPMVQQKVQDKYNIEIIG